MQRVIFDDKRTYQYVAKQLVEQLFESILPPDGFTNVKFLRFSTAFSYLLMYFLIYSLVLE